MPRNLGVTRRHFLASSAAALSVTQVAAHDSLIITEERGGILVSLGSGLQWRIIERAFGRSASIRKISESSILVEGITLPIGVSTPLTLDFERNGTSWTLQGFWSDWDQHTSKEGFKEFVKGVPLTAKLERSVLEKFSDGTDAQLPVAAALELFQDASISVRAVKGDFKLLGGTLRASAFLLNPPPAKSPQGWRAEPIGPLNAYKVHLGSSAGVSVGLDLDQQARLIVQDGEYPIRIQGELALRAFCSTEELNAPLTAAELKQNGIWRHTKLTCRPIHWPFRSRVGAFDFSGDDGGLPFIARVVAQGDRITSFDLPCLLYNHNIAVDGSDRTRLDFISAEGKPLDFNRLDFKGARFDIFLPGTTRRHDGFGYELGNTAKTLRINLDTATLRLARARDLLSLEFRFKNLDFELRGGSPFLVPSKGVGDPDSEGILSSRPSAPIDNGASFFSSTVATS